MQKNGLERVIFYSIDDMAGGIHLSKSEPILRNETKIVYEDINDVLELYNIKKYIDNGLYLKDWTETDITLFKNKVNEYGKIIGQFISKINDTNIIEYYEKLLRDYLSSFWELINNQKAYENISSALFATILSNSPYQIRIILQHKDLVAHYKLVLKDFLISDSQSATILLSLYEVKDNFSNKKAIHLPPNLSLQDKENIISNYIDNENCNLNYLRLILHSRNKSDFKISDRIRLKAKRREKVEKEKIFNESANSTYHSYGVSIRFQEDQEEIKEGHVENLVVNYSYSLTYIKNHNDNYSLFLNFRNLFEFLDEQGRINLVSKRNLLGVMERVMTLNSQNEYIRGTAFVISEMSSYTQTFFYHKIVNGFEKPLENILQAVFTSIFQAKYNFATNAQLLMPSLTTSYLEKVVLLAPQFERVLKQYKLFVEDGNIDFELLQISSSPCTIKDIPSLLQNKYIYLNEDNEDLVRCVNLFFSDQTLLAYVEPHKEKQYPTFFDLLAKEQVNFNNYEEHQRPRINYLIEKGFLFLDENNFIQITNIPRVLILKDLYEQEVSALYHFSSQFQEEAKEMKSLNMVFLESSLFSKPEQSYFNYFLNKSEFTNGLDLRNSYLHGTHENPEQLQKHEHVYFTYLKLLVLVLMKIEDDLFIAKKIRIKSYDQSANNSLA